MLLSPVDFYPEGEQREDMIGLKKTERPFLASSSMNSIEVKFMKILQKICRFSPKPADKVKSW